jgi:hypothetical protein
MGMAENRTWHPQVHSEVDARLAECATCIDIELDPQDGAVTAMGRVWCAGPAFTGPADRVVPFDRVCANGFADVTKI